MISLEPELVTIKSAPIEDFIHSVIWSCIPSLTEVRATIAVTPTTIPKTVKAVLAFRFLMFLTAINRLREVVKREDIRLIFPMILILLISSFPVPGDAEAEEVENQNSNSELRGLPQTLEE